MSFCRISKPLGVLLDVDGTLYHQSCLRFIIAIRLALFIFIRPFRTFKEIKIIKNYREAQEWLRQNFPTNLSIPEDQLNRTAKITGIPIEDIAKCVNHWMAKVPLRYLSLCARRRLLRLIHQWHMLGVPIGVYSDYPAKEKLNRLGLQAIISTVVYSGDADVKALKPESRGFEIAARKMGLLPSQVVYIGDRTDVDLRGSKSAGMASIILHRKWKIHRSKEPKLTLKKLDEQLKASYTTKDIINCWVCGSTRTYNHIGATFLGNISSDAIRITDSNYGRTTKLKKCHDCGFVFADPIPHKKVVDLYRDMKDPEYLATATSRQIQMGKLLDLALSYHSDASTLLDIGAGVGLLVSEAKRRGLIAFGLEPSHWCVQAALSVYGIRLASGTLEELSSQLQEYDLVMLVDVLEHLDEPMSMLRQVRSKIAPGGRLFIVTPDISSPTARIMGKHWWHYRVAHLCFFNRYSMGLALQKNGLELIDCPFVSLVFPLWYLSNRLKRYFYFPFLNKIFTNIATSQTLSNRELHLNLWDSRMFIAKRKEDL